MSANNLRWLAKFHLLILDEVDSTNEEAKRIVASDNSPNYLVVCAKKQIAGKGRNGRVWESQEGNLFVSVIVPKTASLEEMSQLSFVSSLALYYSISSIFQNYSEQSSITLKWPNDVLVNDKKVAGILLETAGANSEYVVVGVGVNVKKCPMIQGKNITSLFDEGLHFLDSSEVLNRFMTYFYKYYQLWIADQFIEIREKWLKRSKGLGQIITVDSGFERVSGKFLDIDFSGRLRIQVASGQIFHLNTGEVFFND